MVNILIFTSWLRILVFTMYTVFTHTKFKKSKKAKHGYLPFFIRKVAIIAKLPIGGLK